MTAEDLLDALLFFVVSSPFVAAGVYAVADWIDRAQSDF